MKTYHDCARPGCSEKSTQRHGFCPADWACVPEDLRERWREVRDAEDVFEVEAAREQLVEAIEAYRRDGGHD
jgi:hypothetical protein